MKKTLFLFLGLSLLLTNCKSDDDGEDFSNSLRIGDDSVNVVFGEAVDYGQDFGDGESYNIDLFFYNYDVTLIDDEASIPDDLVGLYIEGFSSVENRLAAGTYEFSNDGSEFSIEDAFLLYTDFSVSIESGTLEVSSSSTDSYDVFFEGVDENGNNIDFDFSGSVNYVLDTGLKGLESPTNFFGKRK